MNKMIEKYAEIAVPRYTSYPTAPHFGPEISGLRYKDWLAKLDPSQTISLYLHVPFCREMCWYCGCNMKLVKREEPLEAYAASLLQEIELLRDALPAGMQVSHLHFGGGTPTALRPTQLRRLMQSLRASFEILPSAEVAIEADPRTLTGDMVECLGELGFNRASFGVQEFDLKVQQAINRVQPPKMVADAVDLFRSVGIGRINFDLIYGLPFQSTGTLRSTVDLVAQMSPERVALFGYAHVPWVAKNQRLIPADALPNAKERLRQAETTAEALEEAGYLPIGMDHFAKPADGLATAAQNGTLHRNFQGYTDDGATTLLGLGATSIGRLPNGYVQNIAETGAWARKVAAGELPVAKGLAFTGQDELRAAAIERLMCDSSVNLDALGPRFGFGRDWWHQERSVLEAFENDGLIRLLPNGLSITDVGLPFRRVVASVFDEFLQNAPARHSVAV